MSEKIEPGTPRRPDPMKKWWILPALAGLTVTAACGDAESGEGLVARAGSQELAVDDVVVNRDNRRGR